MRHADATPDIVGANDLASLCSLPPPAATLTWCILQQFSKMLKHLMIVLLALFTVFSNVAAVDGNSGNFDELVKSADKNALVKFLAPW